MPRDPTTLLDIARAAHLVAGFVEGMDQRAFFEDTKTQSAVLHQLLILGEAVKRLSAEFRTAHSAVPWSLIAGSLTASSSMKSTNKGLSLSSL